jgi:hypothetical protein
MVFTFSRARSQRRKTWIEAKIPHQANLTIICNNQLLYQIHILWRRKVNLLMRSSESEFINEEFRHEDVEDPSQGFVD